MQDEPHAQRMTGEPRAGRRRKRERRRVERAARWIAPRPLIRAGRPAAAPRPAAPNFSYARPIVPRASFARATQGISPNAVAQTWADWALHLALGARQAPRTHATRGHDDGAVRPVAAGAPQRNEARRARRARPQRRRFSDPAWSQWPFNVFAQNFSRPRPGGRRRRATCPGSSRDREAEVAFMTRALDRRRLAEQHPLAQSGDHRQDGEGRRLQPRPRRGQLAGRRRPHARRQAARGGGGVRGRTERRGHARQGRLPQRPDGADPVRADDRQGVRGADPDHSGLDHEILHPRSRAAELARCAGSSSAATPCSWCRGRTRTRATAT